MLQSKFEFLNQPRRSEKKYWEAIRKLKVVFKKWAAGRLFKEVKMTLCIILIKAMLLILHKLNISMVRE